MSVSKPSRIKVLHIYLKRLLRWRRNSSPYISGDAFSDLADFVFNPPRWRNFNNGNSLSGARIIFCRSDQLERMFVQYRDQINAKVIIAGNSDYEFHQVPKNIPSSIRAIFLQNSFISDNQFIFSIPIGLENFRLGVNGNPKLIKAGKVKKTNYGRILFGPLSATHPVREFITQHFNKLDSKWDLLTERLNPRTYDQIANSYSFIAAVRGNGVDTHRLWESLYRGLIPIVVKDSWWKSLEHIFPQVKTISEWSYSEIERVILDKNIIDISEVSCDALWMPYWENKINDFLVD